MSGPRTPGAEPDVERLHRAILREPHDPREGHERAPWWVWAATAAALFWGGFYLGRFAPSFGVGVHQAYAPVAPSKPEAVEAPDVAGLADPVALGARVYTQRCQACHQADGRGLPPAFPPLLGSEWVVRDAETPIRIVLHGLQGPIEVAGQAYQGAMPAWGALLSDAEIAAVVSHVRQWAPNDAAAVDEATVAGVRAEAPRDSPWTAAELDTRRTAGAP